MDRFENAIFKPHEEINDRMTEMFGLLKELTASRTLEKVLIREEARHPITKNINSISVIRVDEENSIVNNRAIGESIVEPIKFEEEKPLKEVDEMNKVDDKLAKSVRENVTKNEEEGSQEIPIPMMPVYEAILKKKITRKEDIGGNFEIPRNIGGIADDALVNVAGFVYPVEFVILDIKEDERDPSS
ncbi:hypothetical protein Tco_1397909 [Tanacetum coccineum]